jgi:hypothetical protein
MVPSWFENVDVIVLILFELPVLGDNACFTISVGVFVELNWKVVLVEGWGSLHLDDRHLLLVRLYLIFVILELLVLFDDL